MRPVYASLALALAGVQLSGCATVLNGTRQDVGFKSEPAGALIRLATGENCTTPCEIEIRRGDDTRVDINKPGYQPVSVLVQSRLGGSAFGNIIAGGIIGGVVDGSNGASNHLYPNPVYVRLVAVGAAGEAELLDKDGRPISTVAAHNASVEADVREALRRRGLDNGAPTGSN